MNLWYKKGLIFVVAGIAYAAGIFFSNPFAFGFCSGAQTNWYICWIPSITNIGWSFTALGQVLAVVALIMLFANARAWHTWLKFSYWFIPIIALIVIFVFPIPMQLGSELPRFGAITVFGELYAIITFLIVLIQFLRQYRSKKLN